jgi:hypothetical protein
VAAVLVLVLHEVGGPSQPSESPVARVFPVPTRAAVPSAPVPALARTKALPSSAELAAYTARIEQNGRESAIEPFVPYVVAAGEQVVVRLGSQVQTISGPTTLVFQLDPDRASGWRMSTNDASTSPAPAAATVQKGSAAAPSDRHAPEDTLSETLAEGRAAAARPAQAAPSEASELGASWTEAAQALSKNDAVRAEAALERLGHADSAATRDSARLSLAQLWLSQGRNTRARRLLGELSASGATPFIRRRASELLAR